MDLKVDSVKRC